MNGSDSPFFYSAASFREALPEIVQLQRQAGSIEPFRLLLLKLCNQKEFASATEQEGDNIRREIRVRDCAQALRSLLAPRSETLAQFSFVEAIYRTAAEEETSSLSEDFFADAQHLFLGVLNRSTWMSLNDTHILSHNLTGREAAIVRSAQMDELSEAVNLQMKKFSHGLQPEVIARREERIAKICALLGATREQFDDWKWQYTHVQKDPETIAKLVQLRLGEYEAISRAKQERLPFGITPYYLSLMDDDPEAGRDRAVRAQVFPPNDYVEAMECRDRDQLDFMNEADTSPVDLITRRYPSICILKPYNSCPQICVYCQRNWEIDDALAPGSRATSEKLDDALQWIKDHPAIHEVLVTGGDPMGLSDRGLFDVLDRLAAIPSIERIRIGTRVPVTAPMRLTPEVIDRLASYRIAGVRQVALVTHIEHPYELTPAMVEVVDRLRTRGIAVFNQQVYTFFTSRRFETALLRRLLARIGVEPYYTFNTKGKEETAAYRVPLARLLQEQKEEARLLPGLSRTDEGVFNVPGQGKNYLRAAQHRTLISLLPDGNRLYEFHPWEKNISRITTGYVSADVPLLDYLKRLTEIGETPEDYDTIWYYF